MTVSPGRSSGAEKVAADEFGLTTREREILEQIATGRSNKENARVLGIELGTVKSHVSAIMSKLGAMSRTQAASIAVTRGVVSDVRPQHAPTLPSRRYAPEAMPQFAS